MCSVLQTWPLFGIAHRITSGDIDVTGTHGENVHIPSGTVLCFNYLKFHSSGYDKPESFIPERWQALSKKDANYTPFGIMRNRPCPAQVRSRVLSCPFDRS